MVSGDQWMAMIYVNRRLSNIRVETVDAYPSHQQAIERIKELQSAGSVGHYYMAKFPTKEWKRKEVDVM